MHLTAPGSKRVPSLLGHVLTILLVLATCRAASAESITIDGTVAPIVRITIASGDVTVRTWDRSSVRVDGEKPLSVLRRATHQPPEQHPMLIPHAAGTSRAGSVALPAESFVVSTIPPGPRDAILIRRGPGAPAGPVVVTVPSDSVFVFAFVREGTLDVRDYRGGTLVGFTKRGRLALQNVGGTIFVQTGHGALDVADSTFDRMRARSLTGDIVFERCRTHQIEATSVAGSVVYDSGSFEPGLARFESGRGDVAIGTQSPVLLGGRVFGDGRVYTNFARGARIVGTRDDAQAFVDGGGPVVTGMTQDGNVYLYDGSLHARDRLPPPWLAPMATIERQTMHSEGAPQHAHLVPALEGTSPPESPRPFGEPFAPPQPAPTLAPARDGRRESAPHRRDVPTRRIPAANDGRL